MTQNGTQKIEWKWTIGSSFTYLGWHYPQKGFGTWEYKDIQKWCYLEDLLSLAED